MALISSAMVPFFGSMEIVNLLQGLPPILLAASGLDAELTALATPEGIITVAFFGKFALFFAAYPVVMGMRVTANEEDEGILDVVLSLPVPRWQMIVEKFAAYLVTIVAIALMVFIGLWLGTQLIDIPLDMSRMAPMVVNVIPVLMLVLAFTVLAAAIFRRRQVALGVATAFVVGSFMLDTIAGMLESGVAATLRKISFFSYYDPGGVVEHGLVWTNVAGMILISVVLVTGALWAFQRRDVGV
jgi:ABC-2 type transport system permease protein